MKKIIYFYLQSCPYCKRTEKFLRELMAQPRYSEITVEMIEESRQRDFARQFDYYYVPCFYVDGVKIHEGAADKNDIIKVLESAL